MKLNKNYIGHDVGKEHLLVPTGKASFKGVLKTNDTAAFIIGKLKNDMTEEKLADAVCDEYDVSYEEALDGVKTVLEQLRSVGALDE